MVRRLDTRAPGFADAFTALISAKRETEEDVAQIVRNIISDVRARGDAAVIELTAQFDKLMLTPETLCVSPKELADAEAQCATETLKALDIAAKRIKDYHRRQIPKDETYTDEIGATLGWRWTALDSVGLYVPGGTASYPSSVLMNAVPARVAGVARIVMVTPASGGKINPLVLAAAQTRGHHGNLSHRRRAGRRGAGLRHANHCAPWTRSSAPATPMSLPPSAKCSAQSASILSPGLRKSW